MSADCKQKVVLVGKEAIRAKAEACLDDVEHMTRGEMGISRAPRIQVELSM